MLLLLISNIQKQLDGEYLKSLSLCSNKQNEILICTLEMFANVNL